LIDLTSKGWVVFGLRGSGKSWFLKSVLDSTPDHIVYDPLNEHLGYRRYIPTDRDSVTELEEFLGAMVVPKAPQGPQELLSVPALVVIDEANRYVRPKPHPLPKGVSDLVDLARHWAMSFGCVCRRPVQFHTDIVELADYVFFFGLSGKNDYRYMEDLHQGLGDQVRALKRWHFVSLAGGREITVHVPIDTPKHENHT